MCHLLRLNATVMVKATVNKGHKGECVGLKGKWVKTRMLSCRALPWLDVM
jgi:hypothetical protein